MTTPSPLRALIESGSKQQVAPPVPADDASAHRPGAATGERPPLVPEWIAWGPAMEDDRQPEVLATLGSIEMEYAALRRGAGRLDAPHRGTICLAGADRLDLLDRLLTQKVCDLSEGRGAEAFMLDRKGRILADLVVLHTHDATWLDVDVHQASTAAAAIEAMCFGEDVKVDDRSQTMHGMELHGPGAPALAGALGLALEQPLDVVEQGSTLAWRLDRTGEPTVSLRLPAAAAADMWNVLEEAAGGMGCTLRTLGWYALNMARVEAGEPVANIDFGPGNLPAETGLLHRRVSFTKGCYPGQEVVARMHNLGHPKQVLRRLVLGDDPLPIAGAQIFASDDADLAAPLGVVTSSAPAPLAGARPAAMGMLRWAVASPGGTVRIMIDGAPVEASVQAIGQETAP